MYKKLVLVFVCLCCFLTSCRTSRQETQKSSSTSEHYIENKETYRDTLIYAPKAETSLKIAIAELAFKPGLNAISKPKTFTQKNGNATAKIRIEHDTVFVTATCDSLTIVAKIKEQLRTEVTATARSDVENSKSKTGFNVFDVLGSFLIGIILGVGVTLIFKTISKV
ncbi:hypothetical protein [Flavobacterium sp. TAB 87]|uniref:hypothetical protein n=1 Tax=Flavobacterium sp. TAB 87 TaxID=1729581 RepID=UPI00076DD71F|nr:hypothetical protein [Flavobacterium sp. TAB 87]KVV16135.1 hypothetical protein AP058_00300 [Flavobacterium sp. TAB 87]